MTVCHEKRGQSYLQGRQRRYIPLSFLHAQQYKRGYKKNHQGDIDVRTVYTGDGDNE